MTVMKLNHQSEKCSEFKNQCRHFSSNVIVLIKGILPRYPSINTKKILFSRR